MTHQTTVTYTREIIRKAVGHFWLRFIAWHGFAAIAFCIVGTIVLAVAGNRSWLVGALGAIGLMLLTTSTGVYVAFLKRSMWKFNRMASKSVVFTFADERFTVVSDLGSSELSWKAIEQVWRFPELWLLFASKTTYITLPIADIDPSAKDFIIEQVVRHGGRVA
jgi:hypothetical protein